MVQDLQKSLSNLESIAVSTNKLDIEYLLWSTFVSLYVFDAIYKYPHNAVFCITLFFLLKIGTE